MSVVSIRFQDVTVTNTNIEIQVTNGQIGLGDGAFYITSSDINTVTVAHNMVDFMVNTATDFSALMDLPITSAQDPVVQVDYFVGTVTIYWATPTGGENQLLEPGNPMTLSNFVS